MSNAALYSENWTDKYRYNQLNGYVDETIPSGNNRVCNLYNIYATAKGYKIFDAYSGEYIASEIPRLEIAIIISRFFENM